MKLLLEKVKIPHLKSSNGKEEIKEKYIDRLFINTSPKTNKDLKNYF